MANMTLTKTPMPEQDPVLRSRNFNEVFATAADHVIVEAEQIVEVGEIDPDEIMTPGFVVDAVVQGRTLTEA